jgi:hypothetical protein
VIARLPSRNPSPLLTRYVAILARKMGFVALGWVAIYFLSQPMRWVPENGGINILPLFGLPLGAVAGLVAGWYLATDSVEDSGLGGLGLWVILVVGSVLPMWLVEGFLRLLTRWSLNFGGFMILTAATLMALAAAVWYASSQE